jgi:ribose transport system substrate-binding protein
MEIKKTLAVLATAALVVGACSSTASTAAPSGSAAGTKLSIGIVTFSATDVATNRVVTGAQAEAAAKGWDSNVVDAQGSVDTANSAIQNLVQKKVDAIIVTVFPSNSLKAGLDAAQAANIPVMTHGGGIAPGVDVGIDVSLGAVLADRVVADLGGKGDTLALTYRGGLPCREREASWQTVLGANPDIKNTTQQITVPGQVESATAATNAWLAAHPVGGNQAIWTCFDDPAMGAVAALKQNNRQDVKVYGVNGNPDALQSVKDGWLTATLWTDLPAAGKYLVDQVPAVKAAGSSWHPVVAPADNVMVDKTNIDQFLKAHPEAMKG